MNRQFADISNNNTQNMNFEAYHGDGHLLIGIKASEDIGFFDKFHAERCERCHVAGVWVAHYHFGHVGKSAQRQAEMFWDAIRPHFAPPNDVAVIDIEKGGKDGHNALQTAVWVRDFAAHFTRVSGGHHLVGYSNLSFLNELRGSGPLLPGERWWIAAYGNSKPSLRGVRTWAWQHTDGSKGSGPFEAKGIGHGDMSTLNWRTFFTLALKRPPR